mmetsp:Transcript_13011/g.50869  ORF Transcript_13011/g.50869 Transcript_13011/m.50869 type:complete len:441 (+) Transcript_13011:142-1464(+)
MFRFWAREGNKTRRVVGKLARWRKRLCVFVAVLTCAIHISLPKRSNELRSGAFNAGSPVPNSQQLEDNTLLHMMSKNTCKFTSSVANLFESGDRVGKGQCSFEWGGLHHKAGNRVLEELLQSELRKWGYINNAKPFAKEFAGKRILDVGMGQGPIGAALLNVSNIIYYVGMDPAVCPPIRARTRDKTVPRGGSTLQCMRAYKAEKETDPSVVKCVGANKYKDFRVTGAEMMALYRDRLALLPMTFENLHEKLVSVKFDIVMLNTVTEHLQNLHQVVHGLYEVMSGCSAQARLRVDHHNFYSFGGHHGFPTSASQLKSAAPEMMELADWGHVLGGNTTSVAAKESLNGVRPGDLLALFRVYFECKCTTSRAAKAEKERLSEARKTALLELGFSQDELFINHIKLKCLRREFPVNIDVIASLKLYKPPLDGSYAPQLLVNCE